jgi:hypothetical protein
VDEDDGLGTNTLQGDHPQVLHPSAQCCTIAAVLLVLASMMCGHQLCSSTFWVAANVHQLVLGVLDLLQRNMFQLAVTCLDITQAWFE